MRYSFLQIITITTETMSNKGQYSHIQSFKDFKEEKVQLYYNVQLTKKKLELTLFNIRSNLSLEKVLYNLLLNNVVDPMFFSVKNLVTGWFSKLKGRITTGAKKIDKEEESEIIK